MSRPVHLRLVAPERRPIAISDPTRSGGVDINAVAHEEYRARRNPVDDEQALHGPIMSREPLLPLWAVALAAGIVVFFAAQLMRVLL